MGGRAQPGRWQNGRLAGQPGPRLVGVLAAWGAILLFANVPGAGSGVMDEYLPAGFPSPTVPTGNPLTAAKIELGRHLFFDTRLSADGTFACSTCHQPSHAFTDSRPRAIGVTGETHPRSSMSLTNVAYGVTLNWADPATRSLEEQMVIPMFSVSPVEMGLAGNEEAVLLRLHEEPRYGRLFEQAFPGETDPISFDNIIRAIASFERTLISGSSPYDRYVYWDDRGAFPESARRGMDLFFSPRLHCSECHSGFNFSGPVVYEKGPAVETVFHNTALYDLDGRGEYPVDNQGIYEHTGKTGDMGRFRAPTLRNVALTAPYMHDGSIPSLEEVIAHYAAGGRSAGSPLKSELLTGFDLSPTEVEDLIAFLDSLTDEAFVMEPRFSSPWVDR